MENWFLYIENIYLLGMFIFGYLLAQGSIYVWKYSEDEEEFFGWFFFPFTQWNHMQHNGPAIGTEEAAKSLMFFDEEIHELTVTDDLSGKVFIYYALMTGICWPLKILWLIIFFLIVLTLKLFEITSSGAMDGFNNFCMKIQKILKEAPDP